MKFPKPDPRIMAILGRSTLSDLTLTIALSIKLFSKFFSIYSNEFKVGIFNFLTSLIIFSMSKLIIEPSLTHCLPAI